MKKPEPRISVDESQLVDVTPPKSGAEHKPTFAQASPGGTILPEKCQSYESLANGQEAQKQRGATIDLKDRFKI